ncbi:hypothetical protein F5884DRAFT_749272 [Xylogone sp. PMI_703]|nr:hypothetical protein F5884DRAFT_749272 [Xylogone sp. PMI_703]
MDTAGHALQACEPCKARKKKCDRSYPTCTTCADKMLKCGYEEDKMRNEVLQLRKQVETLTALVDIQSKRRRHSIPIGLLPSPSTQYPIQSAWYMPSLIQHYWTLCFPRFSQTDSSDSYRTLASSWMEAVFSDACMFHAALFAASSHIDVLRNECDNPITNYHRCGTRQFLVNSISSSRPLPLTAIAATTFLWHYELITMKSMNSHVEEAVIHKRGLQQMVKSKGGLSKVGFNGFLAHLITMLRHMGSNLTRLTRIDIGDIIMNPSAPIFANSASIPQPELAATLLSATLNRPKQELEAQGISTPLINLLHNVHQSTIHFESRRVQRDEISSAISPSTSVEEDMLDVNPIDDIPFSESPQVDDYFQLACYYAASIHLRCLQQATPFSSLDNQKLVSQIRYYLTHLNEDIWLYVNRETYVWLCFTAAAAAREGKSWFLAKAGPPAMSLADDSSNLLKLGALQFCRLLRYLEEVNTGN